MIVTLKNRLLHELKASAAKSAVLGSLLLVGLYFWVPPLWRAVGFGGHKPPAPSASSVAVESPAPPPAVPNAVSPSAADATHTAHVTWDRAADVLEHDPLVKSADAAAIGGDPFRIDHGQFPPPILFAAEATNPVSKPAPVETAAELPDDVVLKSTIIGRTRRAAFINTRLYHEGADVRVGGETYRLESVHPRRAVLTRGGKTFELKIPGPAEFGEDDAEPVEPADPSAA